MHHLGILAQDGAFNPNLTHSVIEGRVGKAHGFGLLRTTRDQLILRHYRSGSHCVPGNCKYCIHLAHICILYKI